MFEPCSFSPRELLKLNGTLSIDKIEQLIALTEQAKENETKLERYYESVEEQLSFARDLVTQIKELSENSNITTIKDLRKAISIALDESYFEL